MGSIVGADVARKLFRQTGRTKRSFRELQVNNNKKSSFYKWKVLRQQTQLQLLPLKSIENNSKSLTEEEMEIMNSFMKDLDSILNEEDVKKLFSIAKWRKILRNGTVWTREGEEVTDLVVLYQGWMEAMKEDQVEDVTLYEVGPMGFLGSVEFFTSKESRISKVTFKSKSPCR
jgi:hypothetical protein